MYELHRLGWHSFQQLCLTIVREVLGQTVESYLESNDGGRDGAFAGTWSSAGHEDLSGHFVIQCKFTGRENHNLGPRDIAEELPKVERLVKEGRCDCYVLMTNAGVSGRSAAMVEAMLKRAGAKHVRIFGSTWICDQIRENRRLRMMVPRVYGLGDLGQIIDDRVYKQARALLESLKEDLAKVVVTDAYQRAAEALDRHGFVLLIGEPAAGKTTIASLLAMAALDQWKAPTLKLDDPAKVVEHWDPDEPSQFFWVDDAFGVTQYEPYLVSAWNHKFPQIRTMLLEGRKIVMTSRDYIYGRARSSLKEGAFPLLRESQVVIDVRALSGDEKRQILYNHLKLGRQPQAFRTQIKPHLEDIAANPRFVPETARRLSDPVFTRGLAIGRSALQSFVEKQESFLQETLEGLDKDSQAALALIYMRDGALQSPIRLERSETEALERLGANLGDCIKAMNAMNGSLVRHSADANSIWGFKHPTIGDAYAGLLVHNPELLGIYVQGSPPEKLIRQVTCGEVGIERAVVIPEGLFPLVLERLGELGRSSDYKARALALWHADDRLHRFLAWRCSREFLALFVRTHPELLERVSQPGLFLNAVSEVDVAARLHEYGLFPEENRRKFVEVVSEYAVEGEDLAALDDGTVRKLFESEELDALRDRVRHELVPRLDDVRIDWETNRSSDASAEEHLHPLLDNFEVLKKVFLEDRDVLTRVEREIDRAWQWIAERTQDEPPPAAARHLPGASSQSTLSQGRSIFDDIDE